MKKMLAIGMCVLLVGTFTACGNSSDEAETAAESVEATEEVEDEQTDTIEDQEEDQTESVNSEDTALLGCFESLAKQVDLALMDEALRYIDETGLDYEVVELSEEDIGTITTEDDEHGCHLFVAFIYNDDDDGTICAVSYGNDHFSGSVDDNTHATDPIYKIYNIYNDEPNTEVDSLEEVLSYIRDEMPALIEEDQERESGETIDVILDVTEETTDAGTVFTVETNLPDGTELSLSLEVNDYIGQSKVTVDNGKAVSGAFSDSGTPLKGDYELSVTVAVASQQPSDVQEIIGVEGENLTGEYVRETVGGGQTASATMNFLID